MRRLAIGLAVGAAVAIGTVGTIVAVSPTTHAAPRSSTQPCGAFSGTGPSPGCTYTVSGSHLRVDVRNNGTRPIPVRCTLITLGSQATADAVTLGPGARGSLDTSLSRVGSSSYAVDCQSQTRGAKEVARRTVVTARALTTERDAPRTRTTTQRTTTPQTTTPQPTTQRPTETATRTTTTTRPTEPTTTTQPTTTTRPTTTTTTTTTPPPA